MFQAVGRDGYAARPPFRMTTRSDMKSEMKGEIE